MPRLIAPAARPSRYRDARTADADYAVPAQPSWRDVDWAAHLHTVDVGGAAVDYVDLGEGEQEPVVFVHGLGGQWQNWLENLPRVAQERRVIALDLPGFGRSPLPPGEISIAGYGRIVEGLCEALGLGRVELVGNSMGGFIAAEVAIQHPERVDRLVLVSAAGISSADVYRAPVLTIGRALSFIVTQGAPRYRQLASRPLSRHLSLTLVARHPSLLAADLAYEGFFKGAGKPGFAGALAACLDYDFRERLPGVSAPTLIVWGENDSIIPVRDAKEYERLIPDSRKLVMRDTGHISMAERPLAFNEALLGFLAESGSAEERAPAAGQSQVA